MNFGSVCRNRVKLGGGLILKTNCIFEYKPPPLHFRLDVVYKMGHYGAPVSSSSRLEQANCSYTYQEVKLVYIYYPPYKHKSVHLCQSTISAA